jgi:nucleotide-binding universal stress UspA family protein
MIQRILLAIDGSAMSKRATDFTASLALRYHSQVLIVHAYLPIPVLHGEMIQNHSINEPLEGAQMLVQEAANRLRDTGVLEINTDVIVGPPANVILGLAETRKPDLIVIGSRGLGTWQGFMLGSVSMAVSQRAECPVLVVK